MRSSIRQRWTSEDSEGPLLLTAAVAVALVVAVGIFTALTSNSVTVNHGCSYGDGESYCAMARGHTGYLPFSRRLLAPAIVRIMHVGSLTGRFRLVDLVSLAAAAWLTAVLTRRLASHRGVKARAQSAGALVAAALVLLSPFAIRTAVFNPVNTDQLALALGLAWLVLATSPSPGRRWWAVPAAAAAVLTREAWVVPTVVGALASMAMRPRAFRVTAAQLVVAIAAAVVALTRPGIPLGANSGGLARALVDIHFGSVSGLVGVAWALLFAFGIVPLLFFTRKRWQESVTSPNARAVLDTVAVVGAVHLLQTPFGTTDISRVAVAALPMVVAIGVSSTIGTRRGGAILGVVLLGTVLVWQPFHVLRGSVKQYVHLCCPQFYGAAGPRLGSTALVLLPVVAAWAVLRFRSSR